MIPVSLYQISIQVLYALGILNSKASLQVLSARTSAQRTPDLEDRAPARALAFLPQLCRSSCNDFNTFLGRSLALCPEPRRSHLKSWRGRMSKAKGRIFRKRMGPQILRCWLGLGILGHFSQILSDVSVCSELFARKGLVFVGVLEAGWLLFRAGCK